MLYSSVVAGNLSSQLEICQRAKLTFNTCYAHAVHMYTGSPYKLIQSLSTFVYVESFCTLATNLPQERGTAISTTHLQH